MVVHQLATPLTGRDIVCTHCGDLVRVYGFAPADHWFVCGECMGPPAPDYNPRADHPERYMRDGVRSI